MAAELRSPGGSQRCQILGFDEDTRRVLEAMGWAGTVITEHGEEVALDTVPSTGSPGGGGGGDSRAGGGQLTSTTPKGTRSRSRERRDRRREKQQQQQQQQHDSNGGTAFARTTGRASGSTSQQQQQQQAQQRAQQQQRGSKDSRDQRKTVGRNGVSLTSSTGELTFEAEGPNDATVAAGSGSDSESDSTEDYYMGEGGTVSFTGANANGGRGRGRAKAGAGTKPRAGAIPATVAASAGHSLFATTRTIDSDKTQQWDDSDSGGAGGSSSSGGGRGGGGGGRGPGEGDRPVASDSSESTASNDITSGFKPTGDRTAGSRVPQRGAQPTRTVPHTPSRSAASDTPRNGSGGSSSSSSTNPERVVDHLNGKKNRRTPSVTRKARTTDTRAAAHEFTTVSQTRDSSSPTNSPDGIYANSALGIKPKGRQSGGGQVHRNSDKHASSSFVSHSDAASSDGYSDSTASGPGAANIATSGGQPQASRPRVSASGTANRGGSSTAKVGGSGQRTRDRSDSSSESTQSGTTAERMNTQRTGGDSSNSKPSRHTTPVIKSTGFVSKSPPPAMQLTPPSPMANPPSIRVDSFPDAPRTRQVVRQPTATRPTAAAGVRSYTSRDSSESADDVDSADSGASTQSPPSEIPNNTLSVPNSGKNRRSVTPVAHEGPSPGGRHQPNRGTNPALNTRGTGRSVGGTGRSVGQTPADSGSESSESTKSGPVHGRSPAQPFTSTFARPDSTTSSWTDATTAGPSAVRPIGGTTPTNQVNTPPHMAPRPPSSSAGSVRGGSRAYGGLNDSVGDLAFSSEEFSSTEGRAQRFEDAEDSLSTLSLSTQENDLPAPTARIHGVNKSLLTRGVLRLVSILLRWVASILDLTREECDPRNFVGLSGNQLRDLFQRLNPGHFCRFDAQARSHKKIRTVLAHFAEAGLEPLFPYHEWPSVSLFRKERLPWIQLLLAIFCAYAPSVDVLPRGVEYTIEKMEEGEEEPIMIRQWLTGQKFGRSLRVEIRNHGRRTVHSLKENGKLLINRQGPDTPPRDENIEIVELGDANVSRNHAIVYFDRSRNSFVIEDVGSTNGTFCAGPKATNEDILRAQLSPNEKFEASRRTRAYVGKTKKGGDFTFPIFIDFKPMWRDQSEDFLVHSGAMKTYAELACMIGHLPLLNTLIRNFNDNSKTKFDVNSRDSTYGNTLLHWACLSGSPLTAARLLECPGIEINPANFNKRRPLSYALQSPEMFPLAVELLNRGARMRTSDKALLLSGITDSSGHTVLHAVCEKGNLDVFREIVVNGALAGWNGFLAHICRRTTVAAHEKATALLEAGADVNDTDGRGRSAVNVALSERLADIVVLLLRNGAKGLNVAVASDRGADDRELRDVVKQALFVSCESAEYGDAISDLVRQLPDNEQKIIMKECVSRASARGNHVAIAYLLDLDCEMSLEISHLDVLNEACARGLPRAVVRILSEGHEVNSHHVDLSVKGRSDKRWDVTTILLRHIQNYESEGLTSREVANLVAALQIETNNSLRSVTLTNCKIGHHDETNLREDDDFHRTGTAFIEALKNAKSLTNLTLISCTVTRGLVETLSKWLTDMKTSTSLKSDSMSRSESKASVASEVPSVVGGEGHRIPVTITPGKLTTLSVLWLKDCGLNSEEGAMLADAIRHNESLENICLAENRFTSLVVVRSLMASIKSNKSLKNFLASENSSRCDKVTNQVRKCCQCICCCCTINDVDEGLTMEDIFGSTKICMLLTVFATYFFFGIFIMISSTLLLATKALQISTPPDTDVDDEDCLNPTPDGEVDVIKILSVENSDEVGDHNSHRCRGFNGKEWDFTCFGRLQGVDFASAMSKPSEYLGLNVLMISAVVWSFCLIFPIVFPWSIMASNPKSSVMAAVGIFLFIAVLFAWMALVFVLAAIDRSRTFVEINAQNFKNHIRVRQPTHFSGLNWRNFISMVVIFIECAQFISLSFQRADDGVFPRKLINPFLFLNLTFTSVDGTSSSAFVATFWLSVVIAVTWWLLACFLAANALEGNVAAALATFHLADMMSGLLSNTLFLAVSSNLLRILDCTYDAKGDGFAYVDIWTELQCWSPRHCFYVTVAMLCITLYVFSSAFIGINFQVDHSGYSDIQFVVLFALGDRVAKLLASVFIIFFTKQTVLGLILILLLEVGLFGATIYTQPCTQESVIILKATTYSLAGWAVLVTLLGESLSSEQATLAMYLLFGGWAFLMVLCIAHILWNHEDPKSTTTEKPDPNSAESSSDVESNASVEPTLPRVAELRNTPSSNRRRSTGEFALAAVPEEKTSEVSSPETPRRFSVIGRGRSQTRLAAEIEPDNNV